MNFRHFVLTVAFVASSALGTVYDAYAAEAVDAAQPKPVSQTAGTAYPVSNVRVLPELASLFSQEKKGRHGVVVLRRVDPESGATDIMTSDICEAEKRYAPASTFKVPHSIIALELGVLPNETENFFHYDGRSQYYLDAWEHDMNLRDAVRLSNVEAFQVLAPRIGAERMRSMLERLHFGNATVGSDIKQFWLDGSLKVSALELAGFFEALARRTLPVAADVQNRVADIILLEEKNGRRLYGKTGYTGQKSGTGWFAGWVEEKGRICAFAVRLDLRNGTPLEARQETAKAALAAVGLWN